MHQTPETEAQRLDRLANKQRIANVEKYRKKIRRVEWWQENGKDVAIYVLTCLAVIVCIKLLFLIL